MGWSDRFRSIQRAGATAVGVAPVVAFNTVAPGLVESFTVSDVLPMAVFFGPAALSALGMGYAMERMIIVWGCVVASAGVGTAIIVDYYTAEASMGGLWMSPAYVIIFLGGFLGEAIYRSGRNSTPTARSSSNASRR